MSLRTPGTGRFSAHSPGPVFTPPRVPAARCLHALRRTETLTQRDIVKLTGLSASTVSRAVRALSAAGFVEPCPDTAAESGDARGEPAGGGRTKNAPTGRPSIPLRLTTGNYFLGGVAIGTRTTYFSVYDLRGRTIVDTHVALPLSAIPPADAMQHIVAGVHRLLTLGREHRGAELSLAALGVSTPGLVRSGGSVDAAHLHWERLNVYEQLRANFAVPLSVGAAVPAILAAELQNASLTQPDGECTAVFYADDSLGAAIAHPEGLSSVDSIPTLAPLGQETNVRFLADMVERVLTADEVPVTTMVLAGQHFTQDARVPHLVAAEVRRRYRHPLRFRLIPTHEEIVRGIARAVATDYALRDPLALARGH